MKPTSDPQSTRSDSDSLLTKQNLENKSVNLKKSNYSILGTSLAALTSIGAYVIYQQSTGTEMSFGESADSEYPQDSFQQYMQFIAKYSRTEIQSMSEFDFRYGVFKQNYKRIVDHNAIPDSGFSLEINKFADLTDDEFISKYTGAIVPPSKTEKIKDWTVPQEVNGRRMSSLPDSKNWYEEGAVSRPYNQGSCGGCWAFSTASAVESLAYISGNDSELNEYSVQQLIDCDSDNYGCTGGWMYQGFAYVSANGISKRSDYRDYHAKSGIRCEMDYEKNATNSHMKHIGYVEHDGKSNEELRELLQQQPVSIGMFTTGMMAAYREGVFTEDFLHCSYADREVNHGVVLIGYGKVDQHDRVRGRCKEYWIIRNSWGGDWGEEGFFRVCADDPGSKKTPVGTCLVNRYSTWPTLNYDDIDWSFDI